MCRMTRPGAHVPCPGSSQPLLAPGAVGTTSLPPALPPPPPPPLRALPGRRQRRRPCLSAVWAAGAEPTLLRRAVHSWSGYGTLQEVEENVSSPAIQVLQEQEDRTTQRSSRAAEDPFNPSKTHSYGSLNPTEDPDEQVPPKTPDSCPSRFSFGGDSTTGSGSCATTPEKDELPEEETVADSAALLQPRARRLGTALAPAHLPARKSSHPTNIFSSMPGIKNLVSRRRETTSPSGTSSPLVRRDSCSLARLSSDPSGSVQSPNNQITSSTTSLASGIRKCETVLALTGLGAVLRSATSSGGGNLLTPPTATEALQPINRLRVSPGSLRGSTSRLCSRCSSLLSLAANSGSRYSLNVSSGGFAPVVDDPQVLCKLCLVEVPSTETFPIEHCSCAFCIECMKAYVEFEIAEGAYDISCPDAQCPAQGVLQMAEVERLVEARSVEKHRKYRLNREVDLDKDRTWCPKAGCETVCKLCPAERCSPQSVHCPTCTSDFCSNCKLAWHTGLSCDENAKQLAKAGKAEEPGIPFDSDLIKCCPMCNVPIEKDEGCAQMMCKRCKHVFCWYCLTSLDDDFLLRHYDKGPCKNKLGHSRASVIWHRTQVIGIFAGFGILLLVASPLLLLAAPCIVCCKCRVCNAGPKLENEEDLADEAPTSS